MNQNELKEQFLQYAENNLNNKTILEAIGELLDNIGGELYSDGYTTAANRLWTAQDIVNRVLEMERGR